MILQTEQTINTKLERNEALKSILLNILWSHNMSTQPSSNSSSSSSAHCIEVSPLDVSFSISSCSTHCLGIYLIHSVASFKQYTPDSSSLLFSKFVALPLAGFHGSRPKLPGSLWTSLPISYTWEPVVLGGAAWLRSQTWTKFLKSETVILPLDYMDNPSLRAWFCCFITKWVSIASY